MTLPITRPYLRGGDLPETPEGSPSAFNPSLILAQLLSGPEGVLSIRMQNGTFPSLGDSFYSLASSQKEIIQQQWGTSLPQWFSLAEETDPGIFFQDLVGLAQDTERRGRRDLAVGIYQYLANAPGVSENIQQRSRHRVDLFQGGGPLGLRVELWSEQLVESLRDPGLLLGMTAGGLAFRAGRLAGLGSFVGPGRAAWSVRAVSWTLGLGAETVAFTSTIKGVHGLMGQPQDWSWEAFGKELAGTALVLGSLRLAGGVAHHLSPHPFSQQLGMYGGIVLGHGLQGNLGLRPAQRPPDLLIESLAMLIHFNAGGAVARGMLGRHFVGIEQGMEGRIRQLEIQGRAGPRYPMEGSLEVLSNHLQDLATIASSHWVPAGVGGRAIPKNFQPVMMSEALSEISNSSLNLPQTTVHRPAMGIETSRRTPGNIPPEGSRRAMDTTIKLLVPEGRVTNDLLENPDFIPELLKAFNITSHTFDQALFRRGYELARQKPEFVERIAWDVDEVILHWSSNIQDLFRAPFRGKDDAHYQNTPPEILDYPSFQTRESTRLSWVKRLWFNGIQRIFPTRLRQHVQFHPGVRAYLLGLRLGQAKPLVMATTGPAGRILILANEDPALKQIFFGKMPTEPVTITEVRERPNIYTREDLVLAMRTALAQEVTFPQDPLFRDYLARVKNHPRGGVKLKHPALSRLLGKRPFRFLVDDSSTAFDLLADSPQLTVFQPPSARPPRTLNFVLGSPERYLDRMSNGYIQELAQVFATQEPFSSQAVNPGSLPSDYPHQRFSLEIPWTRFAAEFMRPAQELRDMAGEVPYLHLPEPGEYGGVSGPLRLSPAQRSLLVRRFEQEFALLTEGQAAAIRVLTDSGLEIQRRAERDPQAFLKFMKGNFHSEELKVLRPESRPLSERPLKYFSTLAGVLSSKRAVLELLELSPLEHLSEIYFRLGRPQVEGEVARRLGLRNLMTTMTSDGEVGVGLALLEPGVYESGLASLGIDITTARMGRVRDKLKVSPIHHVLAESAYKATYRFHPIQRFNHYRYEEIQKPSEEMQKYFSELQPFMNGKYFLQGRTAGAARAWLGGLEKGGAFMVQGRDFQIGNAIAGLVVIPGPANSQPAQIWNPIPLRSSLHRSGLSPRTSDAPYSRGEDGQYQINSQDQVVAVLGDITAYRTFQLYSQGHRVLHIDRDPQYMSWSKRAFQNSLRKARVAGLSLEGPPVFWQEADWFQTRGQADYVEAYFPLANTDLPRPSSPKRLDAIRFFMEQALQTKLNPRGRGIFVISEESPLILDMGRILAEDPRWEIVEINPHAPEAPLRGGQNAQLDPYGSYAWIIYRPKK